MKHQRPKLLLIDAYNLAYRSFYALPQSLETSTNLPVNALYGFLKSFLMMYRELTPEYLAVCMDSPEKTFRALADSTYKAQRKETPEALIVQLKQLNEVLLPTLKIPFLIKETYEADDLIASLSHQFAEACEVYIASNDKDLFQLLQGDHVKIILPGKTYQELKIYTEKDFLDEYKIQTRQFAFYKALVGDSSDNLKGMSKVGPKTALKLVQQFGTPEALLADESKHSESIRLQKEDFLHFLHMVRLVDDIALDVQLEDLAFPGPGESELQELAKTYEFHSLARSFGNKQDHSTHTPTIESKALKDLDPPQYQLLLKESKWSLFYNAQTQQIQCYNPDQGLFHASTETLQGLNTESLFNATAQDKQDLLSILKNAQELFTYDAKAIFHQLALEPPMAYSLPIQDLQLLFYLLHPNNKSYPIQEFQMRYHSFQELGPCETIFNAWKQVSIEARNKDLYPLYQEVELPLLKVLYAMEKQGIQVSKKELLQFKELLEVQIKTIQNQVFALCESDFNLASPKQLAFILFEKLRLPVIKKTKTGPSTDSEVLDALEPMHPIIALVKKYRELSKLLSTYVLAFLNKLDQDQLLHTTYLQAGPSTGRISSVDPNLQNIPSDQDSVLSIKSVFTPSQSSWVFVSADYSQIDLRVLAHFSEDPRLMEAFLKEEDIHTQTARMIFHASEEHKVSEAERKMAKTINFGILYGMSSFGLSRALKISEKEASTMIEQYFKSYPGVALFRDATIAKVKANAYAETIIARKRPIPELNSQQKLLQQLGERLAFNTIIQGSSADIIKVAMVNMYQQCKDKPKIHLLLQIHDELIWECHPEELDYLCHLIPQIMEHSIQLKVPLKVHIKTGTKLNLLRPYNA
jgi:DNA polymerase I